MMKKAMLLLVVVLVASFQMDCATKKGVKKEVDRIDKTMGDLSTSVEQNETRIKEHDSRLAGHDQDIAKLSKETQEAMQRAQAAEKLAMGKLLYEVTLTDEDVVFASGKATINDSAKEKLDNLTQQLKAENKNVYIEIQGHTDAQGSEEYNNQLGLERAEAVRRYLSAAGIPLHRMSTISYGETRPLADNKTREGRAKNRRVVIQVLE